MVRTFLFQLSAMGNELRRARRSAIRAKTSMPCVSCLAYGNRCSQVRPCSRCVKRIKECLRSASQDVNYPMLGPVDPYKGYSLSFSSNNRTYIEITTSAPLGAYGFSIGQNLSSPATGAGNSQAISAETKAISSAERISVKHLVHTEIIDEFRH